MADNTTLNPGVGGDIIIDEDIGGQKMPVSKIRTGAAGVNGGDVTTTNPFPVRQCDGSGFVTPVVTGQIPASLGQKTMANSLAVVIASDQGAVPVSGTVAVSGTVPVSIAGTVAISAAALPALSGTTAVSIAAAVTANQGTPNSLANRWPVQVSDGTNSMPTADAAARGLFTRLVGNASALLDAATGAAVPANALQVGAAVASAAPSLTAGNLAAPSLDVSGSVRVIARPLAGTGHYKLSQNIQLLATQAANGTLFSFRWGAASLCVINVLRISVMQTAAATATIMPQFQVFLARGFTASDSAGTAVTLTGNNMKRRTSMGTTLLTDARFSTATAGLTVGTRTLDAAPILALHTSQTITSPNPAIYQADMDLYNDGVHPCVLAQNEGIILRGPTVVFGAAGTANLLIEIGWAEIAGY